LHGEKLLQSGFDALYKLYPSLGNETMT